MSNRLYPDELSDDLREILGRPNFMCCKIANAFRLAGRAEIPNKAEAEQAYVLHWLVKLALDHPGDWRKVADGILGDMADEIRAKREAQMAGKAEIFLAPEATQS